MALSEEDIGELNALLWELFPVDEAFFNAAPTGLMQHPQGGSLNSFICFQAEAQSTEAAMPMPNVNQVAMRISNGNGN